MAVWPVVTIDMADDAIDERWMRAALSLARRGLGRTWPNPTVGCIIVKDGMPAGQGWTQPDGRPHAETEALDRAGDAAVGATAYVTLEPCNHYGRTPPCSKALADAGIARVVVACTDPDPRVAGAGLDTLRSRGVDVRLGVLENEARDVNAGFLKRQEQRLPHITLKLATTLDGRIATASGESQWITNSQARRFGHYLRAISDAILVGRGTAIADNPSLTCRLAGLEDRTPVRIVLDTKASLPDVLTLFDGTTETWHVVGAGAGGSPERLAVNRVEVALGADGRNDTAATISAIAELGITRLLVEGGGTVAAALLDAKLVDEIAWFTAPTLIGGDGVAGIGGLSVQRIADMHSFREISSRQLGSNTLTVYRREEGN